MPDSNLCEVDVSGSIPRLGVQTLPQQAFGVIMLAESEQRQGFSAPRAPYQNPFVERLIGSIRRECLDHFLILNEAHLRRVLRGYIGYYNTARPHQSLDHNSPRPRDVQRPALGCVVAIPQVGGLHHIYQRAA
jgi:putative transposase